MKFLNSLKQFHTEESGQDLVEYALVLAAVVTFAVAASTSLASTMSNAISKLNSRIQSSLG